MPALAGLSVFHVHHTLQSSSHRTTPAPFIFPWLVKHPKIETLLMLTYFAHVDASIASHFFELELKLWLGALDCDDEVPSDSV